jgi:putative tricarboxylic transport membrane protein
VGAIVGAALLPGTWRLESLARDGQLGPGFWPRAALLGLIAACLAKAGEEWRRSRAGGRRASAPPSPIARATLMGGIASIVGYVAVAPLLGFPLATALFVVVFMMLCGTRAPAAIAANAVLGTTALLYLFVKLVYLPLPKGDGPFEAVTLALYRALRIF